MLRVMLVIDDYGELLFMQTLLKKLGFDVDGIQSERGFEETFLALNPEILIATAGGKRVNGIEIAENLRKVRGLPKVILLANRAMADRIQTMQIEQVDGVLESPTSSARLLGTIAQLGGLDAAVLLDKYRRLKASLSPEKEADLQILKRDQEESFELVGEPAADKGPNGPSIQSTVSDEQRRQRFQKGLQDLLATQGAHFDRQKVTEYTKAIRAEEKNEDTAALEAERQMFVRELVKKGRKP